MTTDNKGFIGGDSRLRKSAGGASRSDRLEEDAERLKDGTALSPEERRNALRQEWVQEVLPTPPALPGYHMCWLSTTNGSDPIYKRQQIGYEPVKAAELPGFSSFHIKGGEFDGGVDCNEMVLFKLPMERYMDLMTIYHHDMPLEEEGMLKQGLIKDERDSDGRKLGEMEGFETLGKNRKPIFAQV